MVAGEREGWKEQNKEEKWKTIKKKNENDGFHIRRVKEGGLHVVLKVKPFKEEYDMHGYFGPWTPKLKWGSCTLMYELQQSNDFLIL